MKNRTALYRTGVSFCLAALLSLAAGTGCKNHTDIGKQFLIKGGKPRADIVIVEKPPRPVKLAANELQEYLRKISGARLEIINAPGTNFPLHIFVGRSAYTDQLGVTDNGLEHGAFRMLTVTNGLVLLGQDKDFSPQQPFNTSFADTPRMMKEWDGLTGEKWLNPNRLLHKSYSSELDIWDCDDRGSLNAVHEFLRGLGVRWYMPGELGEVVPTAKTIPLAKVDKIFRPDFPLRHFIPYVAQLNAAPRDDILWRFRLGFNYGQELIGLGEPGHGIIMVHGRKEIKEARPEYFAIWGGRRQTELDNPHKYGRPCLSSEGLFQANVKYVRMAFDHYDAPMVSVMPADGYVYLCECDLCKGKATPERGWEGRLSDYVWDYVNRVATEVYKTHPDRKISCCAYGMALLPPEKIKKLSPNVAVIIAQWRSQFQDPAIRRKFTDIRQGWLQKMASGDLYIGDYYLHNRPGKGDGVPAIFTHAIAEDLRSLKGISKGEIIEATPGTRQSWHAPGINHLNIYITSRLYWDANQDVDALLDEYYNSFYGPARKEMKNFFEFAEASWTHLSTRPDDIDKAFALLAAARQAAGNTVYGQRIELITENMQPMKKLREQLIQNRKDVPKAAALEPGQGQSIKLDGVMDEPFWQAGTNYHLSALEAGGQRCPVKTTFKMRWADKALYVGAQCLENDMTNLNSTTKTNDDPAIFKGDALIILLETPAHSYYEIAINPAGAVFDADLKDGVHPEWSSGAEAAVHAGDGFWSVEMRIPTVDWIEGGADPMKCVEGKKPSATEPWYFNVCRQHVRWDTWCSAFAPTGENSIGLGNKFQAPSRFAELTVAQ